MSTALDANSREALRAEIATAFAGTTYPGHTNVASRDDEYPDYEGNTVADFLQGKKWQDITYESLANAYSGDHSALIHFLTDEGFRYYLPAFLMIAIDPQRAGEISDSLSSALTFLPASGTEDKFSARFAALSDAQKRAVMEVLKLLAAHYATSGYPDNPAHTALESIVARLGQAT